MQRSATLAVTLASALGAVGCGGGSAVPPTKSSPATTTPSSGMPIPGGGLTVREALSTIVPPPLAVTGWVERSNGLVRLCSGYRKNESNRCLGPTLTIKGRVVAKSGAKVTMFGTVKGTTFVVSPTVQG